MAKVNVRCGVTSVISEMSAASRFIAGCRHDEAYRDWSKCVRRRRSMAFAHSNGFAGEQGEVSGGGIVLQVVTNVP